MRTAVGASRLSGSTSCVKAALGNKMFRLLFSIVIYLSLFVVVLKSLCV